MESFEKKALDVFGEIVINKSFVHEAGFGSRAIPTYVREWIISHYISGDTELSEQAKGKIALFVQKYVPAKGEKETIKNALFEQIEVQILDNFAVYVNLAKGDRYLQIPLLDESGAFVTPAIVQENEMLLSNGLWGVGTLYYIPPSEDNMKGQIWMREFRPFQLAKVDIDYFAQCRSEFTTDEWVNLLVSSMGFNYRLYSERQKILLISRLIPIVEPRYNLVELAPKGTGKSFVFENMSRYVSVRSGSITPAVLFFNDARKTPGLITRFDCVVIDEAQKVRADTSGELTALLKSYLESGRFGRGSAEAVAAEAGLVMLANIDLDHRKQPLFDEVGLFRAFPNFLRETAFIDRFSGLLPGWDLPRITKETPSKSLGFKGDIFGEILHVFRGDISYLNYVKSNINLINCDDMRDNKAIESGAAGLLKILFPDKAPSEQDFYRYCVNPALEMRQRIRDELCKLDREYVPITMKSTYPDHFQKTHLAKSYVDEEKVKSVLTALEFDLDFSDLRNDNEDDSFIFSDEQLPLSWITPELRELNERIERIELKLRILIQTHVEDDLANIPPHIMDNVNARIERILKKHPSLDMGYYQSSQGKLEFCDLRELENIINFRELWPKFALIFRSKENLTIKFDQLSELRNGIRHSRTINEITVKEGEAAIIWFEKIFETIIK